MEYWGHVNVTDGQVVKFPTQIANDGNAFNTTTGIFEAPVNGTYLFIVSLGAKHGWVWTDFYIKQDDVRLAMGIIGDPEWSDCNSATAATYMGSGSQVWIEYGENIAGTGPVTIQTIHTFTGVLLNTKEKIGN